MNNFTNDLKEFNRACLNLGYMQGVLESAIDLDLDKTDVCRQMSSNVLDFMFDTFCRLHDIKNDEPKDEPKEGIEDDVEKYEGMYNYDDSIIEKLLEDMLKERTENEDNN